MENFVVSARKYRPQGFKSVVGQGHITETLEHAIREDKIPQAMLFCGPRGVGKTTCARIVAKMINERDGTTSQDGFAFNIIELDAASNNSVEDMRRLIDQVRYPPQVGKYKVYIIDEVHMLSTAAFNAFLKTLEEPPAYAKFILATTEKHKILPTILSRCQIFDFKRIDSKDIQLYLKEIAEKEKVSYEDNALFIIAQKSDGGLRDALSMFDRMVTFTEGNLTAAKCAEVLNVLDVEKYIEITDFIISKSLSELLLSLDDIIRRGFDAQHFIAGLGGHFRDLMLAQNEKTLFLLSFSDSTREKLQAQAKHFSPSEIVNALEICNDADIHYKNSKNPRLVVELGLMQLLSLSVVKKKST